MRARKLKGQHILAKSVRPGGLCALQVSVGKWEGYGWKWEVGTGYPTTSPYRNNCSKIGWGEYWISSLIKTKQIHRNGLLVFLA